MEASISFCRAMRCSHHCRWSAVASSGHDPSASRGISHSSHAVSSARFSSSRSGSSFSLVLLPDDVDLGVVGDVPQGDVGHPLVDEPLPHVAVGGHLRRGAAGKLRLLELPVLAVGEGVVGIAGAHDASPRQGQGDAGGVDSDPPPPPLLGHVGRGAGAAGGVQHHVTGGQWSSGCSVRSPWRWSERQKSYRR